MQIVREGSGRLQNSNPLHVGENCESDGQCDNAVTGTARLHVERPSNRGEIPPGQVNSKNTCRARGYHLPCDGGVRVAMKIDLAGRTAVISGASRGLGE